MEVRSIHHLRDIYLNIIKINESTTSFRGVYNRRARGDDNRDHNGTRNT